MHAKEELFTSLGITTNVVIFLILDLLLDLQHTIFLIVDIGSIGRWFL